MRSGRENQVSEEEKKLRVAIEVSKLNLDCRKCTKEQKKWRGCEGGAKQPYVIDGEESEFCPVRLINPMTYKYLDMYHYYKQGGFHLVVLS